MKIKVKDDNMFKYNKILQLGEPMIADILDGNITVEEKIDGSLFRIHIDEKGMLSFGSKGVDFIEQPVEKMFNMVAETFKKLWANFYFDIGLPIDIFAEYVMKPHHNTLKYEKVPRNYLLVFDILRYGKWLNYEEKVQLANKLGLDTVPLLFEGPGSHLTKDKINELLETKSVLGNEKIEGIVVKNYGKSYDIIKFPYLRGHFLAGKYVREEFKELNKEHWKEMKKGPVETLIESLRTEARFQKAYQHLRDEGKLENSPRDIPTLIKEMIRDVEQEEKENIKEALWNHYWRDIRSGMVKGLPEFYKKKLMEEMTVNKS